MHLFYQIASHQYRNGNPNIYLVGGGPYPALGNRKKMARYYNAKFNDVQHNLFLAPEDWQALNRSTYEIVLDIGIAPDPYEPPRIVGRDYEPPEDDTEVIGIETVREHITTYFGLYHKSWRNGRNDVPPFRFGNRFWVKKYNPVETEYYGTEPEDELTDNIPASLLTDTKYTIRLISGIFELDRDYGIDEVGWDTGNRDNAYGEYSAGLILAVPEGYHIVDYPTTSLDSEEEIIVQFGLKDHMNGLTSAIITRNFMTRYLQNGLAASQFNSAIVPLTDAERTLDDSGELYNIYEPGSLLGFTRRARPPAQVTFMLRKDAEPETEDEEPEVSQP